MTPISPTALEEAATKLDPDAFAVDEFGCYALVSASSRRASARTHATAAISAYLAQAEKEGWVMVPRADIVEVRESMEQMDGTFDPETSDYALYHRLDVLLHPELIGYAAAQNGGEPCK